MIKPWLTPLSKEGSLPLILLALFHSTFVMVFTLRPVSGLVKTTLIHESLNPPVWLCVLETSPYSGSIALWARWEYRLVGKSRSAHGWLKSAYICVRDKFLGAGTCYIKTTNAPWRSALLVPQGGFAFQSQTSCLLLPGRLRAFRRIHAPQPLKGSRLFGARHSGSNPPDYLYM